MAWSMHGRTKISSRADRWSAPPPVPADRTPHIDAPTATELLERRIQPAREQTVNS